MKHVILILVLALSSSQLFANCVVRNSSGRYYYFEGRNCERDFTIDESRGERCWNVAIGNTPPSNDGSLEDIKIKSVEGVKYLYVKIDGNWEEVAEVTEDFVLPSLNEVYLTANFEE